MTLPLIINPHILFICASLMLLPLPAYCQGPEIPRLTKEKVAKVDEAVQSEIAKQNLVGVAIGILQGNEIVYLKGYGLADREKNIPVTTQTVFNWASNSKPVCATLAMQLVDKKLLDLDSDIRKYVPEFPEKTGTITMRHLLSHLSGIQHYGLVFPTRRTYPNGKPYLDPVLALDVFKQSPLVSKPGEKVLYSSYAYILASAVVQQAGREPFQKQLESRIAKPLGLMSLQYDMETEGQPYWSTGYTKRDGLVVVAREDAHYWKHGAGGFKSNIADFARWARAVLKRELISPEAEATMLTRQKTTDGKVTSWGLGLIIDDQKISHGGKQEETTTRLVLYPQARHGIVVMTNCGYGNPAAISTAIYQALK